MRERNSTRRVGVDTIGCVTHNWRGVFPAITTPLRDDQSFDHTALDNHVVWLAESGCAGIVTGGSLGEAATLAAADSEPTAAVGDALGEADAHAAATTMKDAMAAPVRIRRDMTSRLLVTSWLCRPLRLPWRLGPSRPPPGSC